MKKTFLLLAFAAVSANMFAQTKTVELKNAVDSANYANGVVMAMNVKRQMGADFKMDAFMAAFNAALKGETTQISSDNANKIFGDYNRGAQQRAIEKNKKEGQAFLDENKKRAGVMTTATGLQYEIMKKGTGTVSPKATDKVEVHYHGTLLDGTIFDSSVDRGTPAAFGLNQVIPGWTEGVQLMHEGDKFKFFLPSNLAYGDRGAGAKIKPGATLVFEVELLRINPN
ncbi:MAG TPA: FKBP-type peptidyl-prolyl cis-trans isomerase [Saprospiraceae bacterium]|nr:FKBP-type peptidyl-prolyl cis-trans isomerase [Saprospiraceae bacterium]